MSGPENKRPEFLSAGGAYDLLYPITYSEGGETRELATLKLRRITAAERLLMDAPSLYTDRLLNVIAALTGEARMVLLKLDSVDLDRIDQCVGFFMQPGQPTGETS